MDDNCTSSRNRCYMHRIEWANRARAGEKYAFLLHLRCRQRRRHCEHDRRTKHQPTSSSKIVLACTTDTTTATIRLHWIWHVFSLVQTMSRVCLMLCAGVLISCIIFVHTECKSAHAPSSEVMRTFDAHRGAAISVTPTAVGWLGSGLVRWLGQASASVEDVAHRCRVAGSNPRYSIGNICRKT